MRILGFNRFPPPLRNRLRGRPFSSLILFFENSAYTSFPPSLCIFPPWRCGLTERRLQFEQHSRPGFSYVFLSPTCALQPPCYLTVCSSFFALEGFLPFSCAHRPRWGPIRSVAVFCQVFIPFCYGLMSCLPFFYCIRVD